MVLRSGMDRRGAEWFGLVFRSGRAWLGKVETGKVWYFGTDGIGAGWSDSARLGLVLRYSLVLQQ